ncbi:MAG: glutathione S-transferase family protein, partial [Aeromonas veronii]
MGSLVLAVGTGSTWAMRAALVLAMSGLTWQEQVFDLEDAKSLARLKRLAPAGLVPWLEHDGLRVHDSLAIAEYVHELCPDRQLYPVSLAERALARSLCAELHAGFRQIRTLLPFFLGAPTRSEPPVEAIGELARLQT